MVLVELPVIHSIKMEDYLHSRTTILETYIIRWTIEMKLLRAARDVIITSKQASKIIGSRSVS